MAEQYTVPNNFKFYVNHIISTSKDEINQLEQYQRWFDIAYYAFNIPIIIVGTLSIMLPSIVPTLMSGVQGVYTFINIPEKKMVVEQRIHTLKQLITFLEREQQFNIDALIGRYVNDEHILEIKTDDDFENYILFIEKKVDAVLNS
jgi:hypothetical protein